LPLRSCGYLGFRTQPLLNPVGVVYAVPCGFTPLSAPHQTRIGPRRSAPKTRPDSITVRAHPSIVGSRR
jgi:hypothetical protein